MSGAGEKRHIIEFQTCITTKSNSGAIVEDWDTTPTFEEYAEYQVVGTREFPVNQKRYAQTTARFRIWYRSNISVSKNRILLSFDPNASPPDTITFNIEGIYPVDGKFQEQFIEVSELK